MTQLAFTIPGYATPITAPSGIPQGGLTVGTSILRNSIQFLILAILLWSFYKLIAAGRRYILSRGEKDKIHEARLQITWAILGLALVFLSFFFVSVFGSFLGITNILNFGQ